MGRRLPLPAQLTPPGCSCKPAQRKLDSPLLCLYSMQAIGRQQAKTSHQQGLLSFPKDPFGHRTNVVEIDLVAVLGAVGTSRNFSQHQTTLVQGRKLGAEERVFERVRVEVELDVGHVVVEF